MSHETQFYTYVNIVFPCSWTVKILSGSDLSFLVSETQRVSDTDV
jgi:hypothetical protein